MFEEKGAPPGYTCGMDRQTKKSCVTCYIKFRNKQPLIKHVLLLNHLVKLSVVQMHSGSPPKKESLLFFHLH